MLRHVTDIQDSALFLHIDKDSTVLWEIKAALYLSVDVPTYIQSNNSMYLACLSLAFEESYFSAKWAQHPSSSV